MGAGAAHGTHEANPGVSALAAVHLQGRPDKSPTFRNDAVGCFVLHKLAPADRLDLQRAIEVSNSDPPRVRVGEARHRASPRRRFSVVGRNPGCL